MRSRRNRLSRIAWTAIPFLPAVILTACSLLPASKNTPLHTYLLGLNTSPMTPPVASGGTDTLLVNLPRAQAGFDTSRIAYLLRPHAVNYYANNQWADTPPRMLAPLLVQAMEKTGCWRVTVQMPAAVHGDYRLDTEILHLQQEFLSQPSRVRLTLRVQLVELRGQSVIAARRFEILEDVPSEDAYGGVIAANRAVVRLLEQVADWVTVQRSNNTHPCQ